ncbi:hypothetical protein VNO77_34387 [Canavalia gladiata]|uniref:Uncharacterized protein n=1 Tax=Canavalia gladiata TaxID=3824 RepID=A0AAN9KEY8_CANGL
MYDCGGMTKKAMLTTMRLFFLMPCAKGNFFVLPQASLEVANLNYNCKFQTRRIYHDTFNSRDQLWSATGESYCQTMLALNGAMHPLEQAPHHWSSGWMELKEQLSDGLMEPEIETMPRLCDHWN